MAPDWSNIDGQAATSKLQSTYFPAFSLLCPRSSTGGGQTQAAAQAVAQAFAAGGGQAQAYSAALASAVASGGCGSVTNVLAQAQAQAQSSGQGQAFSQAVAQAQGVSQCVPQYPDCSTKPFAQTCCTG